MATSYPTPIVVAHAGGDETAPQNTLTSYRSALKSGARVLETDVRFTKDGVPVILHGEDLSATTTGTGPVDQWTIADLRSKVKVKGSNDPVPTLYELLSVGKPYNSRYFVELKTHPTTSQWTAFNSRFDWLGVTSKSVVISFDKSTLVDAKQRGYTTGWIDELGDRDPAEVKPYGDYYLKHHWSVTSARVAKWRAAGLKVYAWTPDYAVHWKRMRWDRVEGVITNKPAGYLSWVKGGFK